MQGLTKPINLEILLGRLEAINDNLTKPTDITIIMALVTRPLGGKYVTSKKNPNYKSSPLTPSVAVLASGSKVEHQVNVYVSAGGVTILWPK